MPTDPWLWNSDPVPESRPALPVVVSRYDGTSGGGGFTVLDNVECVEIAQDIGIDPGRASFRYKFDMLDEDAPQSIEEALGTGTVRPKTIEPGDRIVVVATMPGGATEFLFDGKALKFGMFLDADQEEVHLTAIGWAKNLWDKPIPGARIRDASDPAAGDDYDSDIPAQFNPKGKPNATIAGAEASNDDLGTGDYDYPTFLDPLIVRTPAVLRPWTLAMAARYLIYRHGTAAQKVTYPTGDELDGLLTAREPIAGHDFDPTDPSTFTTKQIIVSDAPITGRDWPSRLNDIVRDRGFGMSLEIGTSSGTPETTLRLFLLQGGDLKDVYLQERNATLDPNLTNLASAEVERDVNQVVNEWEVYGALETKEAGFILTPGWAMHAGDCASLTSIAVYDKTATGAEGHRDDYRLFVYDETAEGHYAPGTSTKLTTAGSLDEILGVPDGTGKPTHAIRRRKPIGDLISADPAGKPYRYRLEISTDYATNGPAIADDTGTWQIVEGHHELTTDRLGIRITAPNPNAWDIGKSNVTGDPYPNGVVKVVETMAPTTATTANPRFKLKLTCVIEGDTAVSGTAERTDSSALPETITRHIDARDRFKKTTVCVSSPLNTTGADKIVRDDSDDAKAEAMAHRLASESGILQGTITVPRLTRYYKIGDRIRQINGRNLGFRTDNGGTENTNTAIYPVVVGVRHKLKDGQSTTLMLSDQDGHRHRIESKIRK